ncbi:MAG TPA: hypothetical protein VIV58_09130 [Kofleriaceae bacterium]
MVLWTASARADDVCTKPLSRGVRNRLAKAYSCSARGVRCYDAHNGRAFVGEDESPAEKPVDPEDRGYFGGERYYETLGTGETATIHFFAINACADGQLTNIKLTSSTVKFRDSQTAQSAPAPSNPKAEGAKDVNAKVDETTQKVNAEVAQGKHAFEDAVQTAKSANLAKLCTQAKQATCATVRDDLVRSLQDPKLHPDLASKFTLLDPSSSEVSTLRATIEKDLDTYRNSNSNIKAHLESLSTAIDQVHGLDPKDKKPLTDPLKQAAEQPVQYDQVLKVLASTRQKAEGLAAAAGAPATTWKAFAVADAKISVRTEFAAISTDDDAFSEEIQIKNEDTIKTGDATRTQEIWPSTTLTVHIDHGRYYLDYGFMFAAVAGAERIANNGSAACPDQCRWGHQPMFVVNAFIFHGRTKRAFYDETNWIPGLQIGLNADLSKISDAISAGIVFEPLSGIAISGGVMFKSRVLDPRATPAADGSLPMEHRFLPFVGISINSDVYEAIKGMGDSGKAAAPK